MSLKEDFLPGVRRNNEEVKREQARELRLLQQRKIAEEKEQARKAKVRKNWAIVAVSYLALTALLASTHAYNELAIERGGEERFHKDYGMEYAFEEDESAPTVGDVIERMGEEPENLIFPVWLFDNNEMKRN